MSTVSGFGEFEQLVKKYCSRIAWIMTRGALSVMGHGIPYYRLEAVEKLYWETREKAANGERIPQSQYEYMYNEYVYCTSTLM